MNKLKQDWRLAPLSEEDHLLCEYAEKLTLAPAQMTQEDVDKLREAGFPERAVHDAAQIISYFNYINRVASGLGI